MKYKELRSLSTKGDKRCEVVYYDGVLCASSNESLTIMDDSINILEGDITGNLITYGNSDTFQFKYNLLVPLK